MLRILTSQQALTELGRKFREKLLPIAKGIYIENPSIIENGCTEERAAFLINESLMQHKEKIFQLKMPSAVFSSESAIIGGFVEDKLFVASVRNQVRTLHDYLLDALPPTLAKRIDSYEIHSVRSRSAQAGIGVEEFERDGVTYLRTIPERSLIDTLVKVYDKKEITISTQKLLHFAQTLGIAFDDTFNASLMSFMSRMKELAKGTNSIGVTQLSVSKAFDVLTELKSQYRAPVVEPTKVSNGINQALNPNANSLEKVQNQLFFYGKPIAKFGHAQSVGWQFDPDSTWFAPMLTHNNEQGILPALLKNVIRESERQNLHEEKEELAKGAFLGNLQTAPIGELPSRPNDVLDLSLAVMQANGQYYGEIEGFPSYTDNMFGAIFNLIKAKNLPAISGCQVKVPAYLRAGESTFLLSPSENNEPFTHIVKIAPKGHFETVSTLEWLGLTLIKAAQVEVPPFALVDYANQKPMSVEDNNDATLLAPPIGEEEDYFSEADIELGGELNFGQSLFDTAIKIKPEDVPPALVIERFDLATKNETKKRIGVEMTTVLGLYPKSKYEGSMEQVAQSAKALCTDWEHDSVELFRNLVANYLVCNGDYHLKNISLLIEFEGENLSVPMVRLSPAYDVVCTPGIGTGSGASAVLCLSVDGSMVPTQRQLIEYAVKHCDMSSNAAKELISSTAQAIVDKLADVICDMPSYIKHQPTQMDAIKIAHDRIFSRISELGIAIKRDYYAMKCHETTQAKGLRVNA